MFGWVPYAMVRVVAFFATGIVLAVYFPDLIGLPLAIIFSVGLTLFYFLILFFSGDRKANHLSGAVGLFAIFLFGYAHVLLKTRRDEQTLSTTDGQPIKSYLCVVRSVPESKAKSWKIEVDVAAIKTTRWQSHSGRVLLYVSKDIGAMSWRYGDQLIVEGSPQEVRPPANPGEFDYKRFLRFKSIYHQQFVQPQEIFWVASSERKGLIYYSHLARAWALQTLYQHVDGDQQQAIAAALVLGVTDGVDNELLSAYAASGAMHVLAVSGMHVGIIYVILLFLLKPLDRFAWSRWVVAAFSLACLWAFAFVTGLSPSVLRAVVMFSLVAIARPFGQRTNIYNTLAASAFLLLIYNPYLIMSVGFQLSYLAVLGIVYLLKPIYNLWDIKNRIGDYIWKITCMSIAAQVATLPLTLFYFHQFPVYFLLSNLFVIVLSTGVLIIGIAVLAINFIAPLAWLAGKLLTLAIYLLNLTVFTTEKLPMSLINNIHITTVQCWLLAFVFLSVIFLFEFRAVRWLYAAFVFALIFCGTQWYYFDRVVKQSQFIVYSVAGHHAFEFIQNGNSYFMADSSLMKDNGRIRFNIDPNRVLHRVSNTHQMQTYPAFKSIDDIQLFAWQNKTVAHLTKKQNLLAIDFYIDYLIVSNNSFPLGDKKISKSKVGLLILDGSNSRYYVDKMRKFAHAENLPLYAVMEQGAFITNN